MGKKKAKMERDIDELLESEESTRQLIKSLLEPDFWKEEGKYKPYPYQETGPMLRKHPPDHK